VYFAQFDWDEAEIAGITQLASEIRCDRIKSGRYGIGVVVGADTTMKCPKVEDCDLASECQLQIPTFFDDPTVPCGSLVCSEHGGNKCLFNYPEGCPLKTGT
jgi:hypothetical protein